MYIHLRKQTDIGSKDWLIYSDLEGDSHLLYGKTGANMRHMACQDNITQCYTRAENKIKQGYVEVSKHTVRYDPPMPMQGIFYRVNTPTDEALHHFERYAKLAKNAGVPNDALEQLENMTEQTWAAHFVDGAQYTARNYVYYLQHKLGHQVFVRDLEGKTISKERMRDSIEQSLRSTDNHPDAIVRKRMLENQTQREPVNRIVCTTDNQYLSWQF